MSIDVSIDRLKAKFTSDLWNTKSPTFFGRVFRNERNGDVIPERYISDNEYQDVLLRDYISALGFFDVQPNEKYEGYFVSDVWICFSVNLTKLYPSLSRTEATETVHNDVLKLINRIGGWKVTGLVRGLPAFSDYSRVKDSDNLHPNYLFRFNTQVKYPINC